VLLLQTHQFLQSHELRLVCNGYYPEIHIVHPRRLEILFSLTAQIQPDWVTALCVLRPVNREGIQQWCSHVSKLMLVFISAEQCEHGVNYGCVSVSPLLTLFARWLLWCLCSILFVLGAGICLFSAVNLWMKKGWDPVNIYGTCHLLFQNLAFVSWDKGDNRLSLDMGKWSLIQCVLY